MTDQKAQRLAELEVKRNRTMADLEAIQVAVESVRKSMTAHPEKQAIINESYIDQLSNDALTEPERQQTYQQWGAALQNSVEDFNNLAAERERLHVQELILVRMIAELDAQIERLREALHETSPD